MKKIMLAASAALFLFGCSAGEKVTWEVPAPENVVMYQVNPRLFAARNALQAVIPQLDSIRSLGVNVVWIMPVYPIGQVKSKNSPYSISNYTAVNPEFGTMEDFRLLVAECHKRGMAFIMDWVANHTAWDHIWVTQHPEWYTQDEEGNIIYPPHTNWTDVADLNYDNHDMRKAMTEAMIYWVREAEVDGFRCDVADAVPADFWAAAIEAIRNTAGRPILMLAEGKDPDNFRGGFDMNYGWDYLEALRDVFCKDSSARRLIAADAEEYAALPAGKVKLRFTTNHDEAAKRSTVQEFGGVRGAMAAYVAAVYLHGAALVYGEQEVAYPEAISFFRYVPVDWTAQDAVRQEYRRLLHIFREHPELHGEGVESLTEPDVLMYEKAGKYLVAVNVRNRRSAVPLPGPWRTAVTDLVRRQETELQDTLALDAYGYRILMK